ncbi:hypothetical protein FA13DRAFT_1132487 [Coprinellus micaceus]|uniref:Uncharacterized protein n=1 Tax=Coprinellus micaceus TaxID=71717 RepID=A0A4Y7SVU5_COPMI|nr:hypothetical protein FA13DRAFT_1132487 [Coprinellus micaceus]
MFELWSYQRNGGSKSKRGQSRFLRASLSSVAWTRTATVTSVQSSSLSYSGSYQAGFKTGDKYKLKDGIFMSPLILKTLAVHYEILASLPEDQLCKRPYGALCTVVQAVHRALEYSLSGAFAQPPGKTGHFSEENWGDYVHQRVDKDGKTIRKSVRRATVFLPTMKSLTDGQWERIVSGAQAFRTTKKEASRVPRIISAGVEEPDDVVLSWD